MRFLEETKDRKSRELMEDLIEDLESLPDPCFQLETRAFSLKDDMPSTVCDVRNSVQMFNLHRLLGQSPYHLIATGGFDRTAMIEPITLAMILREISDSLKTMSRPEEPLSIAIKSRIPFGSERQLWGEELLHFFATKDYQNKTLIFRHAAPKAKGKGEIRLRFLSRYSVRILKSGNDGWDLYLRIKQCLESQQDRMESIYRRRDIWSKYLM